MPPRSGGRRSSVTWTVPERGPNGEAVVILPSGGDRGASSYGRWPLVVALHGRGEALKPPRDGAMGWVRDYGLVRRFLASTTLRSARTMSRGSSIRTGSITYNRQLAQRPFRGLVVLCPYVPDTNLRSHADLADYARYLADVARPARAPGAPRVLSAGGDRNRRRLARRRDRAADRVRATDTFGAVGALQPAVADDQTAEWVELARAARARRPDCRCGSPPATRTSTTTRSSTSPRAPRRRRSHDFADIPGPHDYPFNRGPGAIELLLWHDRVLSRG